MGPTTRAVQELEAAGIESRTLASFLTEGQSALGGDERAIAAGRETYGGAHVFVDEMSFVSNRDHKELLALKELYGFRSLTESGDSYQLQAVDAGKSYEVAQHMCVAQASLTEILRQKTDNLKAFNHAIRDGKVAEAFAAIRDNIVETDDPLAAAAKSYMALNQQERSATLLITLGNHDRLVMNDLVQSAMLQEGSLDGEGIRHVVYESRGLTDAQLRDVHRYEEGNVLRLAVNSQSTGLKRGDYEVIKVDHRYVHLLNEDVKSVRLNPREYAGGNVSRPGSQQDREAFALHEKREISLHEGERIRWSAPDTNNRIANGNMATIERINGDGSIGFRLPDDRVVTLDASDPQIHNLDLGYAQNSHKVQGASADRVIAAADGENRLLATLRAAYVNLIRPINELELYTGDAGKLEDTIARSNSDKVAAVEVAGEHPFAEAIRADELVNGANPWMGGCDHSAPYANSKPDDALDADSAFRRVSQMTILDDFRDYFAPGTDTALGIAHSLDAVPDLAGTLLEIFEGVLLA